VADLPPISRDAFAEKALEFAQGADKGQKADEKEATYCGQCRKRFHSQNAFENHLKSKRHMENVELGKEESMMGNGGTCKMNN
jgi:pre-60S factor REI1